MRGVAALPELRVDLDGARVLEEDPGGLVALFVRQRLASPTQCELTWEGPEARSAVTGMAVRLDLPEAGVPLFAGEVTAVEVQYLGDGRVRTRVRAYDRLHRLRKRQPVRSHVQVTPVELAREMVEPLGLRVESAVAGSAAPLIVQHDRSDLDLLLDHTARSGLYPFLLDGILHLTTLEGFGDPIALELGSSLLQARVEVNADLACRSVAATGWDTSLVERFTGRATVPRSGRNVAAEAPPTRSGGSDERTLVDRIALGGDQAEALAQAELDRRAAAEIVLEGLAEGDPRLRPGVRVDVRGTAEPYAGRYVLTDVEHTVDGGSGYVTRISSAPPPPPRPDRSTVVTWGEVTRVDDPQGLGRVRARLPTYGEIETEWMTVLSAGAGAGKGWVAVPSPGDRVLLLFVAGDPAQGVVLGGLYGSQELPDRGVEGDAVTRYTFTTPGGHRLEFDDATRTVRVMDRNGSFLEMAPEAVRLHAEGTLEIEALGRAITIRGDTVDFQRG